MQKIDLKLNNMKIHLKIVDRNNVDIYKEFTTTDPIEVIHECSSMHKYGYTIEITIIDEDYEK